MSLCGSLRFLEQKSSGSNLVISNLIRGIDSNSLISHLLFGMDSNLVVSNLLLRGMASNQVISNLLLRGMDSNPVLSNMLQGIDDSCRRHLWPVVFCMVYSIQKPYVFIGWMVYNILVRYMFL